MLMESMEIKTSTSPKIIERKFNALKEQIRNSLKEGEIPDESLFRELDKEFTKIKETYLKTEDKIMVLSKTIYTKTNNKIHG